MSRTHRVALDWLFDKSNLDSKIQIRLTDTKHQLADIMTEGNFTRDEWNNLLRLFNIMDISQFAFDHFSSISSSQTFFLTARARARNRSDRANRPTRKER